MFAATFVLICASTFCHKKAGVSGAYIENGYNNRLFEANFVRIENSLYYFYYSDSFGTGLYKITNKSVGFL